MTLSRWLQTTGGVRSWLTWVKKEHLPKEASRRVMPTRDGVREMKRYKELLQ